jgi:phage terminase small subunit
MLTQKQETFCLAYIETKNASEAYRRAYNAEKMKPSTIWRKAKELMDNGNVTARIEELRASVREAAQVSIEGHLNDLKTLRDEAQTQGQLSAAINAEIARGKAAGLYVVKQEIAAKETLVTEPGEPLNLSVLTDDELRVMEWLCMKAHGVEENDPQAQRVRKEAQALVKFDT